MSENAPKDEVNKATEAEDLDVVAHSNEEEEIPFCVINHSSSL